jgi:hypothetical protein
MHNNLPDRLPSDQVVIAAPMSFTGSAIRAWRLTVYPHGTGWMAAARAATVTGVLLLILTWWSVILCWYLVFGLLLVPYRVARRHARKRKIERLRHQEILSGYYHRGR